MTGGSERRAAGPRAGFDPSALPAVIAHRGASAVAPENTLAALREAARLGARWVEVDVKLCGDGLPVLLHDDTLDRTTDGTGPVADVGWDALRRLDAGSWFAERFRGERVPGLLEAMTLCADLGLGMNLEIKANPGQLVSTVDAIAAALAEPEAPDLPLLLSSFDRESVLAARDRLPDVPRALLIDAPAADWRGFLERSGCVGLNPWHRLLAREADVRVVRDAGFAVVPYTVNDPGRFRELRAWGVSSVVTDDPTIADRASAADPAGGG